MGGGRWGELGGRRRVRAPSNRVQVPYTSRRTTADSARPRNISISISHLHLPNAISIHISIFISHLAFPLPPPPSPRCLPRLAIPRATKYRRGDGSYRPRRLQQAALGRVSGISSPFDFILVVVQGGNLYQHEQHEQQTTLSRQSGGQDPIRLAPPSRLCSRCTPCTRHDAARCHHDPWRRTGVPRVISPPTSEALVGDAHKEVHRD